MIKLSILIATIPTRFDVFDKLRMNIHEQILLHGLEDCIEVLYDASMHYNIGAKRNRLLLLSNGEYIVFVDDDDLVSHDYIRKVSIACRYGSDCIAINGTITFNGTNERQWYISKEYGSWYEKNNIYYRTPNHISPVKRELALQAGFPEISFGEDAEYSRRLLPLLKTEVIINEPIYHYRYVQK